jgi:DNA uptake protein ComE-like DNA-binding protein
MTDRTPPVRATLAALAIATLAACSGAKDGATDSAAAAGDTIAPAAATPTATASADSAAPPATDGALLDPNAAPREQLVAVPGMTPGAADALIAGRPYADMRAVDRVLATAQIDSAARRTVYARVFRPIDLNAASGEEIVLIPGVGARMRHEFEEYRPYKSMDQFRREIGKYVDAAELARLEKYVALR